MPKTWDVIVLGAGVFGLATARRLAQLGHKVLVLDKAPVGTEASGWALGRIDPLLRGSGSTASKGDTSALTRSQAQSDLALRAYAAHMNALPALQSETGIDLQFDDRPTLQLLYSAEAFEEGRANAAEWTRQGFKSEIVSTADVTKLDSRYAVPGNGAILMTGPFFIDSLSFARALESSARGAGVAFETATVSRASFDAGGVTVHTDQGHYSAGAVVVALGPWAGEFCREFGVTVPVEPSKGEILRMTVPAGRTFGHHLHGPCSLVHKKDGQVWVAATAAFDGFNREPTDWARDKLLANARQMMPAMKDSKVTRHTVCFRPATPDDMPVVGRLPVKGPAWVVSGGGGSGIMQCLVIGDEAARMVAAGESEPDTRAISLGRF